MHYEGPQSTDLDNVKALNETFLALLRRSPCAQAHLQGLPEDLARRLISLTSAQAARLAEAPFLLLSFRERDERFWHAVFELEPTQDLFSIPRARQEDVSRLIAAGLGFIWQLARQNPYVLRLLCGATVHWCEQIGEHTLIRILNFATDNHNLLVLRLASSSKIWRKLLYSGVHPLTEVRRAVHMSVLQTVLTEVDTSRRVDWATAACRTTAPKLKVADEHDD
ncbi:MAG: flagellar transcriptional regulator FlhD [Gammaproteobacteria bacterium]|nr:flagellar transcriptional regulator FlhD [Gammaproteobacteria bacterium]